MQQSRIELGLGQFQAAFCWPLKPGAAPDPEAMYLNGSPQMAPLAPVSASGRLRRS
jgi:hypothetical protein